MLTVEQAQSRIFARISSMSEEVVQLDESAGRLLARPVVCERDVPPWDNSSMDGYAVRASDTSDGSYELQVNEVIGAGVMPSVPVAVGTTSAIMTGAPMPEGADAVVMVENTDGSQEGTVQMRGQVPSGKYVRRRGSDMAVGQEVLRPGQVLNAGGVGLVSSLGHPEVWVRRRPVVSILSTGDEVVMPGNPIGPGQIYSSNNVSLATMVRQAGAVARNCGNAPDDLDELVRQMRRALMGSDVLITTGGVSMGAFDHVREAHQILGVEMDFWKVRMKPGKPLAFGWVRGEDREIPVFGLPGNPVSCMVNFLQFVRPWLRMSMGDPKPYLPVVDAVAGHDFKGRSDRVRFERVVLEPAESGWVAHSTGSQGSGILTGMAAADGLACLPLDQASPVAGERIRVQLIRPGGLSSATPGYGW